MVVNPNIGLITPPVGNVPADIVRSKGIAQVPEAVKAAGKSRDCFGKIVNFSSIAGRQ